MKKIIVLALIGLVAQLIDGSLGMAYGVTSTTLLLMVGLSPAMASASVHLAEVVTSAASGYSHFKFGNVDLKIVKKLVLPGAIGAFSGAAFLSYIPSVIIKPYISIFLLGLGIYVILRFLLLKITLVPVPEEVPTKKKTFYRPVGLVAGFLDASGGGGWGPLTTPLLLTQRHLTPNTAIGTVNFSEFAVSLSASIGFFLFFGWESLYWQIVLAMMVGGVIAAPFAAWLVKRIKPALLGVLAGGLIILTNLRTILKEFYSLELFQELEYLLPLLFMWLMLIIAAVRKKS
ncbi:sulfite exporter TauE/SafE family protein [Fictibacillus phosphorivorans]|uniref:sulfite exporter TauE/SafE family protein n=1 Tax=Fictibacillus phosphorivorans TaxID=1221500 RepID=UPI00203FE2F0|nr:sulfite exporter TauE/SafE family protein [Fictibacillus phosphorivorans]MCM3776194.1 sulfite exporter TauE/SafE family protein [Fictibacillus phosphorivorans]